MLPVCWGARKRRAVPESTARRRWRVASVAQAPLLVGAAVAGPEDDLRAVGRTGGVGVQAESGLHTGDGAVGVDVPLLVGLSVAVPDDDGGAVGGAPVAGVEALGAIDRQLFAGRGRPALHGAAPAVVQLHLGAVRGAAVGYVDAAAGLTAHDLDVLLPATAAGVPVAGRGDVGLDRVLGRVGRVAGGHHALVERAGRAVAVVAADAEDDGAFLLHRVVAGHVGPGPVVERRQATGLGVAGPDRPMVGLTLDDRGEEPVV